MQVNRFLFGLFVCASFCACSNDESGIIQNDPSKVFAGDEAYISVRLADAGALTRGTTTDPGYEYGTATEHDIKNAFFYFYDANGVYVAQGSAWNGGNAVTDDANIEFKGNNVVVLKGLTQKNYPKYMVTVLNGTSDFDYGTTLAEMEKKLAKPQPEEKGGIYTTVNGTDYFTMSTTSFKHNAEDNLDGKYFVTEVKEENFSLEPIDHTENANNYVTVYVERLAVKVTLDVSADLPYETIGNEKYYVVKATLAGEGNDDDVNNADNEEQTAAEDLYVHFLGWKLNATTRNSRIVKNINEAWTDDDLGFTPWNKPTDHRSFWGMSYNYGIDGNFPDNASDLYDTDGVLTPNEYLNYFSLKDGLTELGKSAYCAENTNTSKIVSDYFPSVVTSILLKAEICDANGNALDLVRFNGVLFKKDAFLKYIANVMNTKGQWNVWTETTAAGSTDKKYEQATAADVLELVDVSDGVVKVQLKANLPTLYKRTEAATGGNPTFDAIDEAGIAAINTKLADESADAIGYKGGLMYYNIPIEHLNNNPVTTGANNETIIPEAKYGVVRNHHYVVTVNKLEKIGKGIFDPDEVIVPGKDDDKDTYYVGANINILSWKIVSQNVDL